jgi:outer membrane protein OmpA-like peptidoglycan-associated protein
MSLTTPADNRADATKKWVESFNSLATLLYKIAAAAGAVITFLYLFSIDFFPQGLTPGEVVFFVFVALAFGFLYFVFLLYGAFSSVWIVQAMKYAIHLARFRASQPLAPVWAKLRSKIAKRRKCSRFWQRTIGLGYARFRIFRRRATRSALQDFQPLPKALREPFLVVGSFFVFLVMGLSAVAAAVAPMSELLIAFLVGGFVSLSLLPKDTNNQQTPPTWLRWLLATSLPLLIVVVLAKPTPLLHMVFQGLGIRVMQATIEVPDSETATFERISELIERPIIDCRRTSERRLLVHGVDVLWNGIGNQVLLGFSVPVRKDRGIFEREKAPLKQATIRLNASQVHILRAKPPIDPCFDLPTDMLFETASFKLTGEAMRRLDQLVAAIKSLGTPSELLVRGHSDPRPISNELARSLGDNQRLSERRANTVAQLLQDKFSLADEKVQFDGIGSREPKIKCPALGTMTRYESEQCNRPNRRVEIRMKMSQRSAETQNSKDSAN